MPKRRSCDRCYKNKEKCHFRELSESCTQCERSGTCCTTIRSRLRQGRRPKAQALGPRDAVQVWEIENPTERLDSSKTPEQSSQVGSSSHQSSQISTPVLHTPVESQLEFQLPDIDSFYKRNNIFMLGPSFAERFHAIVLDAHKFSPALLDAGYQAISTALKSTNHPTGVRDQIDIGKGSLSLEKLRTAEITSTQGALVVVLLGQTIAAFDLLTNCIGARLILRYCLSSIQPWYEELSEDHSYDPVTITPIFWDTVCCILEREVPVIRFQVKDPHTVDRTAGLCTTLLPILYELCETNYNLKHQSQDLSYFPNQMNRITQIRERIHSWIPTPPPDFETSFTSDEILTMETQASMYKTAALLVIHRIQNPIGAQNEVANNYAANIMGEFLKYTALVGPGAKFQNGCFPVFMALLEISTTSMEEFTKISFQKGSSVAISKLQGFIDYFRTERRQGFTGSIFDLVENGPDFVTLP